VRNEAPLQARRNIGVPINVDGHIIGVSADVPEHDEQIAKAGVAALSR
jgi:glc operon protein GlcG